MIILQYDFTPVKVETTKIVFSSKVKISSIEIEGGIPVIDLVYPCVVVQMPTGIAFVVSSLFEETPKAPIIAEVPDSAWHLAARTKARLEGYPLSQIHL